MDRNAIAKRALLATVVAGGLLATSFPASAGETVMITDRLPSPAELASIIFHDPAAGGDEMSATRSFRKTGTGQPEADLGAPRSVGMQIYFGFNSAEVLPESRPYLNRVAALMRQVSSDRALVIVGHTDASGPANYNLALSAQRASAVRLYLIEQEQVEPERLSVSAEGEAVPLPNYDPFDPINRRVEFAAR